MATRLVAVVFVVMVLAVLTMLGTMWWAWSDQPSSPQAGHVAPTAASGPAAPGPTRPTRPSLPPPPPPLAERIEPAVVRILTDKGLGSGFVVDPTGLICTNYHVIDGASQATVTFKNQRSLPVIGVAAADSHKDLVLLSVQAGAPLPSLHLSPELPPALAVVTAFGSSDGFTFNSTQGSVSAVRRGEEVRKMAQDVAHVDLCQVLGFDTDSTWIQDTASISHNSSGGPLVDMQGNVVGINTWCWTGGQNLYFAVAAQEIREFLPKAAFPRPLSSVPPLPHPVAVQEPPKPPPPANPNPGKFSIAFPSGARLTSELLATDSAEPTSWNNATGVHGVAYLKHSDGLLYAICGYKNDLLDGVAVTVYPEKNPAIYATYADGRRHGVVKIWNADGKGEYWAQYFKGRRNGFCCSFKEGNLQLVLQCEHGATTAVHLISGTTITKSFADEEAASANEVAAARLEALEESENRLLKNEQEVKQEVRRQVREEVWKSRQQQASSLGVAKRNNIISRASEHAAETAAVVSALRTASGF